MSRLLASTIAVLVFARVARAGEPPSVQGRAVSALTHARCAVEGGDPQKPVTAVKSAKKGVALQANYFRAPNPLQPADVGGCYGASWYYTWGSENLEDLDQLSLRFVPMILGDGADVKTKEPEVHKDLRLIKGRGERCPTVLLFNEPDINSKQDVVQDGKKQRMRIGPPQVTADDAAARFDDIKKALPCASFGAPVTAFGGDWRDLGHIDARRHCANNLPGAEASAIDACSQNSKASYSWEDDFDKLLAQKGESTGFATMHLYMGCGGGSPSVDDFKRSVYALWKHHGKKKKVWITEMGISDWDSRQGGSRAGQNACMADPKKNEEFVRAVIPWLEGCPYVERYAWFTPSGEDDFFGEHPKNPKDKGVLSGSFPAMPSLLWDAQGLLTPLGKAYAEAGPTGESDCQSEIWDRKK